MPEVKRVNGFVFRIHLDDHAPPHVHVWKAGAKARITIGNDLHPPGILSRGRMLNPDLRAAIEIVKEHSAYLLICWEEIHGTPTTDR